MYRSALRTTTRAFRASRPAVGPVQRRFASTAARKGTWKGTAVRWGAAGGALYWYNTSPLFAEEVIPSTIAPPPHFSEHDNVTVDAVVAEKRRQAEARAAAAQPTPATAPATTASAPAPVEDGEAGAKSPAELEAEAGQQGAFNPETGEINWDCPCLGGMAHGPCGDEFKAAFSCFVYSEEEPKGMDCIEKFQHMQDCFRKYPEIYAPELAEDEEAEAEAQAAAAAMDGTAPPPGEAGEGVSAQAAEAATLKANTPAPVEAAGQTSSKVEAPAPPAAKVVTPSTPAVPAVEADGSSFEALLEEARLDEKKADKQVASVAGVTAENTPKGAYDATGANEDKKTAKKPKTANSSS